MLPITFLGKPVRAIMSPPSQCTDRCSPHGHCRPLAFIKTERGGKKNGEKTLRLEYLTLTIFWGERAINDIAAHIPMFAHSPLPPACVYKNRAGRQKER